MNTNRLRTAGAIAWVLACALGTETLVAGGQDPASTGVDLEEVLGQARDAIGWDRVVAHSGAVEVFGDARMRGTEARQRILFDGRGRRLQTFEGPLPTKGGFDGDTEWTVDWTGTPRVLELGDRANAEVAAALLNGAWTGDQGVLRFLAVREEGELTVLEFAHENGILKGTIELDRETHLPRAFHWGEGSHWVLGDFRDHQGYRFPDHVTLVQAGANQTLDTRSVAFVDAPEADVFAPELGLPADTSFDAQAPALLELKQVPSGHLLVHPTIDGKDLGWFIFDTGAGINCISTHVADQLLEGPFGEVPAKGVGGTELSRFWRAGQMTLGRVTVESPVFMGLDLSFLKEPFGVEVAGIVGYGFLARCVVEFDMSAPSIALYDPREFALPENEHWEELLLYSRQPNVRASFEGHEGVFKVDTGAADTTVTMHYPVVQEMSLLEGRSTTAASSGGIGGTVALRAGELESFVLGGRNLGKIQAEFATENKGVFSNAYTWGNIGGKLLEPFVMVFDYPDKRIAFVAK